ncbi:hypothetical protein ACFQV2_21625 [Actinokineospora soli]|uniref:Uncharacterized protein n=1 Tax=Actinokineospora soli TaxID=1048753 RepID=A0ABW2TS32_9PSEU
MVGGDRGQRVDGVADLAGEDGGGEALAADVAEHDERLAVRAAVEVQVVEVAADQLGVRGGAVTARVLDAARRGQRRREQPAHEGRGDVGLLGVQAGRGQRGPGARGEQAGEDLLAVAERVPVVAAQQHERARGQPVPGQRGDHHGPDRPGDPGQQPLRHGGGVDPARRDGREALQRLGEPDDGGGIGGDQAAFDAPVRPARHYGQLPADGGGDQHGGVREVLGGQLDGDPHAPLDVQGRQQDGRRLRQERGARPLGAEGGLRGALGGVVGQPPRGAARGEFGSPRGEPAPVDLARAVGEPGGDG